ncbi:MAG: OmpA family protein [Bacteroidales bacterium]|nr:OmpA family protein [Bacteroidales bacterium]MCF8389363.1 OmpA family protein [Bacteroidales bacterium]
MFRLLVTIILFSFSLTFVKSQSKEEKKEFKKKFLEADYFFMVEEYDEAAFLYQDLLRSDPTNANLQFLTGANYLSLQGQKSKSIPYLEKAVQSISPSYREGSYKERNAPKESLFAIARAYHVNNQLDLALEYYEKYKTVMQVRDVAEIEFINKQIKSVELSKVMILDTVDINSKSLITGDYNDFSRYNSVYSEEDSLLLYMSNRPFYDAIIMTRIVNGIWTKPEIINGQIELDGNIKLCSVSFDGKEIYISRKENYNSELFMSKFKDGKWDKAVPLSENINTIFNETHAVLSKDKSTLYFTSDRPGGYGAMDIYYCTRKTDGEWGEAKNLGKPINAIYSEETPFITADGKTLYFSSMSHATMGGFDIFYSSKLPGGTWSYPANLGFPISSNDDDLHYFPLNNGQQALYTGQSYKFSGNDLAMVSPADIDPKKLTAIKGKIIPDDMGILDENTNISLINTQTKEIIAVTKPDENTGEYNFDVTAGDYEIRVESVGYDTLKESISLGDQQRAHNINVESTLTSEQVSSGEYVISKNILFDFDKSELSEESKFELEKLYLLMDDNPEMMLELTGHTDSKGSAEYNLRLSNRRNQSIIDYLVSRGISKERFISKSAGETNNIAINENPDGTDNPEGRKFNRQVELNLLSQGDKKIWLEEYMVPEHLKPEASRNYYVILTDETDQLSNLEQKRVDNKVKLYETGRKHIYAAGSFANKRAAIEYLNQIIDTKFDAGRIVDESEFKYLLQPSVPDLEKIKGPFTIQLMALRQKIDLDQLPEQKLIRQIQSKDKFYRYISGVFDEYSEAQDSLVYFVLKGYTDAFIIPLARFDATIAEDEIIMDNYDFYYTIQFSATRKPANEDYFKDIENIVSYKGKDDFYRYSTGIFLNKLEADKTLQEIKKMGFSDAFVKRVSKSE